MTSIISKATAMSVETKVVCELDELVRAESFGQDSRKRRMLVP